MCLSELTASGDAAAAAAVPAPPTQPAHPAPAAPAAPAVPAVPASAAASKGSTVRTRTKPATRLGLEPPELPRPTKQQARHMLRKRAAQRTSSPGGYGLGAGLGVGALLGVFNR